MAGFSKLFIGTSVSVAGAAVQVVDLQQSYSYNIPRVKYITIIPPISKIHKHIRKIRNSIPFRQELWEH